MDGNWCIFVARLLLVVYLLSVTSATLSFREVVRGGRAELLLCPSAESRLQASSDKHVQVENQDGVPISHLLEMAEDCRQSFLNTGIAHIPQFIRKEIVDHMVQEAQTLHTKVAFYSSDDHTIYQEPNDPSFPPSHPRNALQRSSKWIVDFDRIQKSTSPLAVLYSDPTFRAFVAYVVCPPTTVTKHVVYRSGCPYNAAYYNIYEAGDGLGWHFDRSIFGVNLELQPSPHGGNFQLCWKTRSSDDLWSFGTVQAMLDASNTTHCRHATNPMTAPGPGSLVIFAGSQNLHRVTPVISTTTPRINAIMTYETKPHQKPNAYSLRKFFGR